MPFHISWFVIIAGLLVVELGKTYDIVKYLLRSSDVRNRVCGNFLWLRNITSYLYAHHIPLSSSQYSFTKFTLPAAQWQSKEWKGKPKKPSSAPIPAPRSTTSRAPPRPPTRTASTATATLHLSPPSSPRSPMTTSTPAATVRTHVSHCQDTPHLAVPTTPSSTTKRSRTISRAVTASWRAAGSGL